MLYEQRRKTHFSILVFHSLLLQSETITVSFILLSFIILAFNFLFLEFWIIENKAEIFRKKISTQKWKGKWKNTSRKIHSCLYLKKIYIYIFSFIHMCIQCLGHFSPLTPTPFLTCPAPSIRTTSSQIDCSSFLEMPHGYFLTQKRAHYYHNYNLAHLPFPTYTWNLPPNQTINQMFS
jgi:hypothetical protein